MRPMVPSCTVIHEPAGVGIYKGLEDLKAFISHGRKAKLGEKAGAPLVKSIEELQEFRKQYSIPKFTPASFQPGQVVRGVIGLDGGSTSSKAVLVDEEGTILLKEYQLSKGNPIQDTKELLGRIWEKVHAAGAQLEVIGFGATGYAADVLEKTLKADVNIVETVAHMMSAVHFFGDVDVICDIGGQDIKVLFHEKRRYPQIPPVQSMLGRKWHAAAGDGGSIRHPDPGICRNGF